MDKDERIKELEDENAKLKDELQTTKEHLKKYTAPSYKKEYYEKNKEKVMENGANYLHKLKEENPDKLKEYRRRAYLKRKEKLEKEKNENI